MEWIELYVKIKIFGWLAVVALSLLALIGEWALSEIERRQTKRAEDLLPPVQEREQSADEKWAEKVIKRHASR